MTAREPEFLVVPAGTKPTECRGPTCGAVIYFITHPKTGRPHPVDCDVDGGEAPSAHKDSRQLGMFDDIGPPRDGRGVTHFTTCLDAAAFRRGVGR